MKRAVKAIIFSSSIVISSIGLGDIAYAEMPNSTVVVGENAFNLNYANDPNNFNEIKSHLFQSPAPKVYIKAPNGVWFNNDASKLNNISLIPSVTYTDGVTQTSYEAGDGNEIADSTPVAPEVIGIE
ncbi:hypothetical protein LC040_15625 [Bacillus tianshenii]|nr:hypothetical protein LC040_15625 [Bacillus tianshenii]